jgi:hypothetical protein
MRTVAAASIRTHRLKLHARKLRRSTAAGTGRCHTPLAGLTHFDPKQGSFSAYRFHEDNLMFFRSGLHLTTRVGETSDSRVWFEPQSTTYWTYTWIYEWRSAAGLTRSTTVHSHSGERRPVRRQLAVSAREYFIFMTWSSVNKISTK